MYQTYRSSRIIPVLMLHTPAYMALWLCEREYLMCPHWDELNLFKCCYRFVCLIVDLQIILPFVPVIISLIKAIGSQTSARARSLCIPISSRNGLNDVCRVHVLPHSNLNQKPLECKFRFNRFFPLGSINFVITNVHRAACAGARQIMIT